MSTLHRDLVLADLHSIHAYTVADTAALNALPVTSADIGKVALRASDTTFLILESASPVTWRALTLRPATTVVPGLMSAADKIKLDGIIPATTSVAGLLSAADKIKLDGLADADTLATALEQMAAVLVKGKGTTTKVPLEEHLDRTITPEDFGAKGDGTTDDSAAIQAAYDFVAVDVLYGGVLEFHPKRTYRCSSTLYFNKPSTIRGNGAKLLFDASVLEGIVFGGPVYSQSCQIVADGLLVMKAAADTSIESIAYRYLCMSGSTFSNLQAREFRYGHKLTAVPSGGLQNNTFLNLGSVHHRYGLWIRTDGGWVNQNTFIGGRFSIANASDAVNVRIDVGNSSQGQGNNYFLNVNAEGTGYSGVYDDGEWNVWMEPRVEGTWSVASFVFGVNSAGCRLFSSRYDTIIADYCVNPSFENSWMTLRTGQKQVCHYPSTSVGRFIRKGSNAGTSPGVPAFQIKDEYGSSGYSYINEWVAARFGADSYFFRGLWVGDGRTTASLSTSGKLFLATSFAAPLQLNTHRLWVDASGILRIRSGLDPASDSGDSHPVSTIRPFRIATATPVAVSPYTDEIIVVKRTVPGPTIVNLPSTMGYGGKYVIIKDGTGDAATNNITINRGGASTIDGATSKVINTNYGYVKLVYNADSTFSVIG